MPANEFYDSSGAPSTSASLSSSTIRAEFDAIEAGFNKLPTMAGNGGEIIAVNSGATALEAITTTGTGSGVRATSPSLTTPAIAGATLSGTLAGTPTFSGALTTNEQFTINGAAAGNTSLRFRIAGTTIGLIGASGTWLGTSASNTAISAETGKTIEFYVNGSTTKSGEITSTGLNSCAIGATTASTGAFTTLSATTSVTVSDAGAAQREYTATNSAGNFQSGVLTTGHAFAGALTAGKNFSLYADGSAKVVVSPTGAAVTGTLSSTGALTTNGGLQTFGANDSGGAGFRQVLVPNA